MIQRLLKDFPSFRLDPLAALEAYHEYGFHVEYGFWTEAQVEGLVKASQYLPSWQDGTLAPAMNMHREGGVFMEAMCNPALVGIVERLVGDKVSGLQSEFFFCPPGTPGFTRHQDNFYVQAPADAFVSAWTALQDTTPEMGGLAVYPGTHRESLLPVEEVEPTYCRSQDKNANRLQAITPKRYRPLPLTLTKGSVVFLHGHTVHSSGANQTDQYRRALLMTYLRMGETFRPGSNAGRAEFNVYRP